MTPEKGKLIILSGPSGAGKSTVVRKLLETCDLPLELSVSVTTRTRRPNEVDGRDYRFVNREEFDALRAEGKFLEYKEVFGRGDWYGTLRDPVFKSMEDGKWVILEIDVQGALAVMESCPDPLSFFVHPGSQEELEARLQNRGTDDPAAVKRRLEVAADEMTLLNYYKYEIINRDVELAVAEICQHLQEHSNGGSRTCLKN